MGAGDLGRVCGGIDLEEEVRHGHGKAKAGFFDAAFLQGPEAVEVFLIQRKIFPEGKEEFLLRRGQDTAEDGFPKGSDILHIYAQGEHGI